MTGGKAPRWRFLAKSLVRSLPTSLPPVIVASMGRSGSTLVHSSVVEAYRLARFGRVADALPTFTRRVVSDSAFDSLDAPLHSGVVYKTHALAEELPAGSGARVVFLFGSASAAARSVLSCEARYGPEWVDLHLAHLRARGSLSDVVQRDVLRFEEQIDGWMGRTDTPTLGLRYETLWEHQSELEDFIGLPVRLPERRARTRSASISPEMDLQLQRTYSGLDSKISALPDFFTNG